MVNSAAPLTLWSLNDEVLSESLDHLAFKVCSIIEQGGPALKTVKENGRKEASSVCVTAKRALRGSVIFTKK